MKITTLNGVLSSDGTSNADIEPIIYGEFIPVEMTLKAELDTFDTFDYIGYIDYCDNTGFEKIETRTTHTFTYPAGYAKDKETIRVSTPVDTEDDDETTTTDGTIQTTEVEVNKVILFFERGKDYGKITSELLSQVNTLKNPFPDFVEFHHKNPDGFSNEYSLNTLVIDNPEFKTTNGLTSNIAAQPVFYGPTTVIDEYGYTYHTDTASTFRVFPKIYDNLDRFETFPYFPYPLTYSEYSPTNGGSGGIIYPNLEDMAYQGDLGTITTVLLNFNLNVNSMNDKLTGAKILAAYPKSSITQKTVGDKTEKVINFAPTTIIGFWKVKANRYGLSTDLQAVNVLEIPDTSEYYDPKNIETLINVFDIDIQVKQPDPIIPDPDMPVTSTPPTPKVDPLPLGPDYSKSTTLITLFLPENNVYIDTTPAVNDIDPTYAYGAKLSYWNAPNSVKQVANTNYGRVDTRADTLEASRFRSVPVLTYETYLNIAGLTINPKRLATNQSATEYGTTQMIADPLPTGVELVYGYYQYYGKPLGDCMNTLLNPDGTPYIYPPLPSTVIAVTDYFSFNMGEIWDKTITIPGLPSSLKHIKGYLTGIAANSQNTTQITGPTPTPPGSDPVYYRRLTTVDNFTIEPNNCTNMLSVTDWMKDAYNSSTIDLSHRTTSLISPLPTLDTYGLTKDAYYQAFYVLSDIPLVLTDENGYSLIYLRFANRSMNLNTILDILPDLSNPTQNSHSYYRAFSGEFYGTAEDAISKSTYTTPTAVFQVGDDVTDGMYFSISDSAIPNTTRMQAWESTHLYPLTLNGQEVNIDNRSLWNDRDDDYTSP